MSSLSSQLQSIKLNQNALKIGPHQEQPTILFDKYTARNTSIDTIYSLAILAYDKISSHLSNALQEVQNREQLLSESLKEVNRNTLTKDQNNKLSRKLEKFIIELAPFLLNSQCQHVFEYLLRNFKVNVFEAQILTLALLNHWNFEIYQKIISNINKKQMTGKLTFLNQMVSNEQINFSFIIKTLTFSHAILDKLISIVLQGSLLQIKTSKDEMIQLGNDQKMDNQQFLKHPLKNFLLKIFLFLIKQKRTNHYKYIIDFCSSCLRIKYPVSKSDQKFQLMSSVLILLAHLVFQNGVSDDFLGRVVKKLLNKFISNQESQLSKRSEKQIFDFTMLVWQRKTHVIDREVLQTLSQNSNFFKYLQTSASSKYMIFHHIWNSLCFQGTKCQKILQSLALNTKNQEFYKLHQHKFMSSIFEIYIGALNQKSISVEQALWIQSFIKRNFRHQFGHWINENKKVGKQVSQQILNNIFQTSQINQKNKSVHSDKIKKVLPEKKAHQSKVSLGIQRMKIQQQNQQDQSQDQKTVQKIKHKKLIELVRSKGVQAQNELNFSDQDTKKALIQLFNESYSKGASKDRLSFHQKILVIQKFGTQLNYDRSMLNADLHHNDYAIHIKLLVSKEEKQSEQISQDKVQIEYAFLQQVFSFIAEKKQELENILFKELLRLSMNRFLILAKLKYKQGIQFLHKYYKKWITSCKTNSQFVQVNHLILKVSQKMFTFVGNNKGKYQNLIHSHCRLLAFMINNIEAHEFNNKNTGPVITHQLIETTYCKLIEIFGSKQLYLINVGVIELITRKQLNYKQLKYFIDDVMIKQLNFQIDNKKQSKISMNYYEHALSVGRCLVFSSYMLGATDSDWISSIESMLTSGIAKNQISIFYGLIKDKLKRNIARKLFLFFKLTYQSKKFIAGFKNYLTSIDNTEMRKVLHIYSQLYYILLSMKVNDPKIQTVTQNLLDSITNLFSLDLRLTLFKPILPNLKLYGYLTSQLQLHAQANFDELAQLINVVPDELSFEWVNFVKECLKRGHKMSPQCIQTVFTNQHFLNHQDNFQIYCQLICHFSQYDKDAIVPYVNQSMNMILAVCSTDPNKDYCLSIIYRIIINLKQLVDPFVHDIYKYALENNSEFVEKFIADTVEYLTVPTLIQTVVKLSKTTQHLYNFGVFFKYVCKNGVGHLLAKTLQYFASKTIHNAIQDEVDLSNLYDLQAQIFLEMALKFNQNELRKVLIDFVRWAETKQNEEISISFNMRKIVLSTIYTKLSGSLGNLFTPFYGYVFDSYLKDFQNISNFKADKAKSGKRQRVQSNFADQTTSVYLTKILQSLCSLFANDTEKQFLDSTKFDILSQKLSNLFIIQRFQYQDYIKFTNQLSTCLLKLCNYLTDDYQLKSLNLKILLLLRFKQSRSQQAIFSFMDKLIDQIQDRYLLFINDLVPFLIDNIHNRNEKVKIPIKSIINKFEDMSGSKIENYIK